MGTKKVVDAEQLDGAMTATADAIRKKSGTQAKILWEPEQGFMSAINAIPSGGGSMPSVSPKEVNFYDYDGTCLYSYTVEEAAALEEMPPLPEHDGLICQGWNWPLYKIAAMGRAVNVGAMYITDDGKTRIYITLHDGRTSPMLGCCPNGTVTVDWGDGTEPDVLTGTSTSTAKWTPNHEYAAPGDYVITLTVDGTMGLYGSSSSNQYSGILRHSSGANAVNRVYQNAVQKVEIGSGVTSIGSYAFYNCHSLASITIPDGVTFIGNDAFYNCYSLASITIPDGVTFINNSAFYSCYSLASITIPDSVTSMGSSTFQNCYSLASITIPDGMTSIGSSAFYNCYGVRRYDFTRHSAVPTLSNTYAFNNIAEDCEIRVPAALAEEWKAATNWSTYADKIVGV